LSALSEAFKRNFTNGREVGASVSVFDANGEVETLHGGFCDAARTIPWTQETLVLIWSATKGLAVSCVLHAMEKAGIDMDARVGDLWPDFANAGKNHLTFAHVLSHRAGLCALNSKSATLLDHESVIRAVEAQVPLRAIDAGPAYGPRVFGFILDEIVRRLSGGESIGSYWRRFFGEPLGLDIWIGLPEEFHSRVATMLPPRAQPGSPPDAFALAFADPDSLTRLAFSSIGGVPPPSGMNATRMRSASLPSLGGIASASALARFYSMLAIGVRNGSNEFFGEKALHWMSSRLAQGFDGVLQMETAYSAGFMLDPIDSGGRKSRQLLGPSLSAFGHAGAGGSLAFADPETGIGFAYLMNQMELGVLPNDRCLALVDAFYSER
jgi:CubicO group peptidase (beta-lactamase class C family)